MDKIAELEGLLETAAKLAAELHAANNALKPDIQSPHVPGLRSKLLGAIDALAAHKSFKQRNPEPAPAAEVKG